MNSSFRGANEVSEPGIHTPQPRNHGKTGNMDSGSRSLRSLGRNDEWNITR
jgi:hypothetical protein